MADGLYVGMAAAAARSQQLDAVADNLANAETNGYKATRPAFQSFLAAGPRVTDKVATAAVATGIDMSPGQPVTTDNPLDVLPEDNAFFAVATAQGRPAFTRDGALSIGAGGQLLSQGLPLLGTNGQPIVVPPDTNPVIQDDGTVLAAGHVVGQIGLFRLDGNVSKVGPALYQPVFGGRALPMPDTRLRVGELEMGNAPALESAVAMISAQRHFETAMQAIQTYRRMDERANELGKVR